MNSQDDRVQVPLVVLGAPTRGWPPLRLDELWKHRELLLFFAWRDLQVRYKQTLFGAAWAVLQPLCSMLVFAVFFGRLAGVPSGGIPYPIFAYAGLLPWTYFANALTSASNSLVEQERIISKVYFPRLILPLAPVIVGLVDLVLPVMLLLVGLLLYGFAPAPTMILLLPLFLLTGAAAFGTGIWLSALNVRYRDVRYAIPFIVQLWLFLSPVVYPSYVVPVQWRMIYAINPMVGIVEGVRWAVLPQGSFPGQLLAVSLSVVAVQLLTGLYYFRRAETTFADMV